MVIVISTTLLLPLFQNAESKLLSTIQDGIQDIEAMETIFYNGSYDDLMTYKIFDNTASTQINSGLTKLNAVHAQLAKINADSVKNEDLKDRIVAVRKYVDERYQSHQETVIAYNRFHAIYRDNNASELSVLRNDDNKNIQQVVNRLSDYFSTKDYWQQKITDNKCPNNSAPTTACQEAERYYDENQTTLEANTSIPRLLFTAYIPQPYLKESLLYTRLQVLAEELNNA